MMAQGRKLLQDRRLWVVTFVVFALFITFFDRSNFIEQRKLKDKIGELEVQKSYYEDKIETDSVIMMNLQDDYFLEQYGREHYKMKRDDEIIYVIRK